MIKEITSLQHPKVKHLVKLQQSSRYRNEQRSVVIEGKILVRELCPGCKTKCLMAVSESLIPRGIQAEEVYIVDPSIIEKICGAKNPEGLLAEVEKPVESTLKGCRRVIAFDRINDPGNLGTLLRTALAFGWEGAFIVAGSCDPFNDKSLRAARGATFRLPIQTGTWDELNNLINGNGLKPVVADLHGLSPEELSTADLPGLLLVMGNESHGVSEEAAAVCQRVTIPMCGEMESLNVSIAGGILMYLLRGKR